MDRKDLEQQIDDLDEKLDKEKDRTIIKRDLIEYDRLQTQFKQLYGHYHVINWR